MKSGKKAKANLFVLFVRMSTVTKKKRKTKLQAILLFIEKYVLT